MTITSPAVATAERSEAAAKRSGRILRILELAPIVIVLFVLFGGALILAVLQSLGFAPWYGINTFPDFTYFGELWGSSAFWVSLGLTLYYGFVSTIIALVMAIALSLALIKPFRGKTFYKYLYKLPLMIPYTVGIALAVLMLGNGGVLSRLLAFAGMIDSPSEFPQILKTHYGWGIIAVYVWKQVPFMTLAIYAVLLGIGRETEEAATILGADRRTVFFQRHPAADPAGHRLFDFDLLRLQCRRFRGALHSGRRLPGHATGGRLALFQRRQLQFSASGHGDRGLNRHRLRRHSVCLSRGLSAL